MNSPFYTTQFSNAPNNSGNPFNSGNTNVNMNTNTNLSNNANNTNVNMNNNTNTSDNTAHHFLSRHQGFDSAKLSARANDLERRFGGARVGFSGGYGGAEEKKEEQTNTTNNALINTANVTTNTVQRQTIAHLLQNATSLSQLLSAHHEMCLASALESDEKLQRLQKEQREEERQQLDWGGERLLLTNGGGRFLSSGSSGGGGGAGGGTSHPGGAKEIIPRPQILTTPTLELLPFHSTAIDVYLKSAQAVELSTSLREGIENYSSGKNEGMKNNLHQYGNGLGLLESVLLVCGRSGNTGGTGGNRVGFSGSGFGGYTGNSNNNSLTNTDLNTAKQITATLHFFSQQFYTHMSNVVTQVNQSSTYTETNLTSCARMASSFAEIVLGSQQQQQVWARLFYCLRCGDCVAAASVLQNNVHVDGAVSDLIGMLADIQGECDTIFLANNGAGQASHSLLSPSPAMIRTRLLIADLYEGIKTKYTQEHVYQAACLAMLGGSESISEASILESSGLVKTVEDYLYASLWHALFKADADGLKRTSDAVARLGSLVKEWGPEYFEQDEGDGTAVSAVSSARDKIPSSGGWAYALPLLACQQYGEALAYLAEAGGGLGLMQAVHLAVVMDGIVEGELFCTLVSSFSASLQGVDVGCALRYLMLLSGRGGVMRGQLQRLILETRQFETLAGKIEQDGTRSKAALDEYFSANEISSILAEAAGEAVRVGTSADAAEMLVLAGRYSALFSLMNRKLASHLAVTTEEEFHQRQFWFNAAQQFHNVHLAGGRNYVQKILSDEGNLSLGNTFQLLLNLTVFFDRHREQNWQGAWDLIDYLELIPRNDSDMSMRMNQFNSLDSFVRREFHHVIIASMEALCHLYRAAKQSIAGSSSFQHGAIDQRINELGRRSRLLVTFAGVINLPVSGEVDTYAKLAQLEKNMM